MLFLLFFTLELFCGKLHQSMAVKTCWFMFLFVLLQAPLLLLVWKGTFFFFFFFGFFFIFIFIFWRLGIALKLTIEGSNQFVYPSTYVFMLIVVGCLLFQLNYLNLALDLFSAATVSPVYYVFFTIATITSNIILFHG